jgi:hypothetical protein
MKLDSCKTTVIDSHIMKLLRNYDCSGLKENYILVYVTAEDFAGLCRKYRAHLEKIDYKAYPLQGKIAETKTGFNKIMAHRARHRCHKGETVLIHILVEM